MARLSPVVNYPDRRNLLPNVMKGEYYVMKSSLTGDTKYVYPRMMQSSYFPVVTKSQLMRQSGGLGSDAGDLLSLIASAPEQVQQTREDVAAMRRAANLSMLTGLASVVMLGILLWRTR
jgi:hypothetical protein